MVEDGVLIRCEPFERDPVPSPLLASVPASVYSDRRIRAPMVRRSWLRDRHAADRTLSGRDDFVEVTWNEALALVADEITRVRARHGAQAIFAGSYGWSSAGRLHHARSQVRRFYFSNGGAVDQTGNSGALLHRFRCAGGLHTRTQRRRCEESGVGGTNHGD